MGAFSQAGNWATRMLDLDGDGAHSGAGELNDSGTFNAANELTARNTDSSGGDEFTLAHDAVGNLTDDGEHYKYTYDAWGRLRQVKNQSNALVIEHRYNGLGFRLGWHGDADADGTVESNSDDPWYFVTYDPSWRSVATFRAGDSDAKELFVPHASPNVRGLDGVILRDRDASVAWNAATDGTREERTYYCQNHRGDIVQLIWSTPWGVRRCESVRYSAFGIPTVIASGDFDGDGDEDSEDSDYMAGYFDVHPPAYSVVADLDLDGDIDEDDDALQLLTSGGGRGLLSTSGVGNRRGYAGYEHDWAIESLCHVRHRAYLTELGRWTRRDPLGYVEGMSLYAYVANRAIIGVDPMGLIRRGGERMWCADPSDPWCNSGPLPPESPIDIGSPAAGPGGGGPGGGGPPPPPPSPPPGCIGAHCEPPPPCKRKRLIYAFEGLGGYWNPAALGFVNQGLQGVMSDDFKSRNVLASGSTYGQGDFAVNEAAAHALAEAAKSECDPPQYPVIVVIGFSQGGNAAIQFANRLGHQGVPVHLGFTLDPIGKGLEFPISVLDLSFEHPESALAWYNRFQRQDNLTFLRGTAVKGAINTQVHYPDLVPGSNPIGVAHSRLGSDHATYQSFADLVDGLPRFRR